jgi:uncharacterized repeat protein (TIGR01451 family)
MKQNNIVLSLLGIAALALTFVPSIHAETCTTTEYGGTTYGTNCIPNDLDINKQVKNPISNIFVENLTTTDATFKPGSEITYKLIIKNNSGQTFNPVNVKDILPPYLTFVAGPGTYDSATRTLSFSLENLIAGETRTVEMLVKVVPVDQFPSGKSLFCVVNVAEVRALNRFDSDSAQACLQNGVGITTLPVAGFDSLALLLPFAGVGLGGFALLKGKKRG